MITAPTTCHQTEMLVNNAINRWEKMLIMACSARMTAYNQKISWMMCWSSAKLMKPRSQPQRPNSWVRKNART